jgi:hypothetical protein
VPLLPQPMGACVGARVVTNRSRSADIAEQHG